MTTEEMALLRTLIAGPPLLNRHALSKEFCQCLPEDWTQRCDTTPVLIEPASVTITVWGPPLFSWVHPTFGDPVAFLHYEMG